MGRIGNINHIALAKITQAAGGDVRALNTAVFDSARYAVAHVLDGHAEVGVITATSAASELAAGSLRAIAVSAPAPMAAPFAGARCWLELGIDCVIGTCAASSRPAAWRRRRLRSGNRRW